MQFRPEADTSLAVVVRPRLFENESAKAGGRHKFGKLCRSPADTRCDLRACKPHDLQAGEVTLAVRILSCLKAGFSFRGSGLLI